MQMFFFYFYLKKNAFLINEIYVINIFFSQWPYRGGVFLMYLRLKFANMGQEWKKGQSAVLVTLFINWF